MIRLAVLCLVMASCVQGEQSIRGEDTNVPPAEPFDVSTTTYRVHAFRSCQADVPPYVNAVRFTLFASDESECDNGQGLQQNYRVVRLAVLDETFIDNPIGSWRWTADEPWTTDAISALYFGRSREYPEHELRGSSRVELRESDSEGACSSERTRFRDLWIAITRWNDGEDFTGSFSGVLTDGRTVGGPLTGNWRDDIVDCD
ncbi:MAG: hypothetical protein AAF411_00600 [Myxococcota bacterium]